MISKQLAMKTMLSKSLNSLKIIGISLVASLVLFSPSSLAENQITDISDIREKVKVENGTFSFKDTQKIPSARIEKAIIDLPKNEKGTIDNLSIIGPDNQTEFGCQNIDVVNGTDLIQACGGPANLKAGKTTYKASGSNFRPESDTVLRIDLIPSS